MRFAFITTCSAQKRADDEVPYPESELFTRPGVELLRARGAMYRAVRAHEVAGDLRGAAEGRDVDGDVEKGGPYLPAFRRYGAGSFVSALRTAFGNNFDYWLSEFDLFFISGLYGLVDAQEPIQNYNVDLTDAADRWDRGLLTKALLEKLGAPADGTTLLDCCVNPAYARLVDWDSVAQQGFGVRHAIGPDFEYRQVRSALGSVAAVADAKASEDQILSGCPISRTDADVEFVDTATYRRFVKKADEGPTPDTLTPDETVALLGGVKEVVLPKDVLRATRGLSTAARKKIPETLDNIVSASATRLGLERVTLPDHGKVFRCRIKQRERLHFKVDGEVVRIVKIGGHKLQGIG